MAIDKRRLTCKNCLYFNGSLQLCNSTKESTVALSPVCARFHPDGLCCRYCQFFGNREVGEDEEVPLKNPGTFEFGYCQRAGLNYGRHWNQLCSHFYQNFIDHVGEDPATINPTRNNGTLKVSFSDFPEIKSRFELKEKQTEPPSSGCYIATAVYGSYDCPEVWTLRRFRDDFLQKHTLGRFFIRTYYAISPKLVKWFGNARFFRQFWKSRLDRMVEWLQKRGVSSQPYQDR
ncbi:MAG: CFI-box-CTERM domain-containing protein [bacterium]